MVFPYRVITSKISRPIVPIVIRYRKQLVLYSALIDSGADYCIFSVDIAEALNIKLSDKKISFLSVGTEKVYGHWGQIEIKVGEDNFYITQAIFAKISDFGHGILGQQGFFDHFDVNLSYQDQKIELRSRQSETLSQN